MTKLHRHGLGLIAAAFLGVTTTSARAQTRTTNAPTTTQPAGKAPAGDTKKHFQSGDTKFKAGDKATVALGSDGRLSVHNNDTGHTQHWTAEGVDAMIDELLVDALLGVEKKI